MTFLKRSDVNLKTWRITLRKGHTKSGKGRVLPIDPALRPILTAWEEQTKKEHPDCK